MKTLLLLRHGKAEEESPAGDKGRKLTKKGERDAAFMGARIVAQFGILDFVVASDAARARRTAELAASAAGCQAAPHLSPAIYNAEVEDLLAVVQGLPDAADTVLLVGHNPGLPLLGLGLDGEADAPPDFPPASLLALRLDVTHWQDVAPGCGRRLALLMPENHRR